MAKDRRTKDQKRKAKLAERAARLRKTGPQPYEGMKYKAPEWVPHVYRTELPIYETIMLSGRKLTNDQVHAALVRLIDHLREGRPPLLAADAPDMAFVPGNEADYLVWNIRRHWRLLFAEEGPMGKDDLVGILRTLLRSMEAQAWRTGRDRGYVAFLEDFIPRLPPPDRDDDKDDELE